MFMNKLLSCFQHGQCWCEVVSRPMLSSNQQYSSLLTILSHDTDLHNSSAPHLLLCFFVLEFVFVKAKVLLTLPLVHRTVPTVCKEVPDWSWFLKDYDTSLDPGTYAIQVEIAQQF